MTKYEKVLEAIQDMAKNEKRKEVINYGKHE